MMPRNAQNYGTAAHTEITQSALNGASTTNTDIINFSDDAVENSLSEVAKAFNLFEFGNGGAKKIAEELDVKFLGEIPLDVEIRKKSDSGEPVSLNHNFEVNSYFKDIAKQIVYFIENEAIKFNVEPTIKME